MSVPTRTFPSLSATVVVVCTLALVAGLLSLTPAPAEAVTTYVPTIDCRSESWVRVVPGIVAHDEDPGYVRVTLARRSQTDGRWYAARTYEGWVRNDGSWTGQLHFGGLVPGRYAAHVQRWRAVDGRWQAYQAVWANQAGTGSRYVEGVFTCYRS